jgi:hypothetical protein
VPAWHIEQNHGIGVGDGVGVVVALDSLWLCDDGMLTGNQHLTIDGSPIWSPKELIEVGDWDGEGVTNVAGPCRLTGVAASEHHDALHGADLSADADMHDTKADRV